MSSQARAADARAGDESGPVMVADRYRIHPDPPPQDRPATRGLLVFRARGSRRVTYFLPYGGYLRLPGCSVHARPEVIAFVDAMSSQARAADARAVDESGPVMVADRYRIHPDLPLPALDAAGGIRAFNTTDERGSPKALFALVCRRDVAPRAEVLNQFARFNRLPPVTPPQIGRPPRREREGPYGENPG